MVDGDSIETRLSGFGHVGIDLAAELCPAFEL
jgi:hypothetical protein